MTAFPPLPPILRRPDRVFETGLVSGIEKALLVELHEAFSDLFMDLVWNPGDDFSVLEVRERVKEERTVIASNECDATRL